MSCEDSVLPFNRSGSRRLHGGCGPNRTVADGAADGEGVVKSLPMPCQGLSKSHLPYKPSLFIQVQEK